MKDGYAGKIKQTGTQTVKAPLQDKGKQGTAVTKSGSDLRNGKNK